MVMPYSFMPRITGNDIDNYHAHGKGGKHTRTCAPKVRTGCVTWYVLIDFASVLSGLQQALTVIASDLPQSSNVRACRKRHFKCDEEKPHCRRCRDDAWSCEGYRPLPTSQQPFQEKHKGKPNTLRVLSPRAMDLVTGFLGSDIERRCFHHFQTCTVADLTGAPEPADFWYYYVLPLAHVSKPIKHSVIALGAAHRLFLAQSSDSVSPAERQTFENLVVQQYNQSIRHIRPLMSSTSTSDIQLALIGCLLFIRLESMRGRYAESLRHLRAGARALASLDIAHGGSYETYCDIADMFSALGVGAAIFTEEDVVPNLSIYSRPNQDENDARRPFANFTSAQRQLTAIDAELNMLLSSHWVGGTSSHSQDDHSIRECAHELWQNSEIVRIRERVRIWIARFDQTVLNLNKATATAAEINQMLVLSLSQRMWLVIVDQCHCWEELRLDQIAEILDQADAIIPLLLRTTHPVFAMNTDIISILAFCGAVTDDPGIRRRAISLLRLINRREGVWDSHEIAECLEAMLFATQLTSFDSRCVSGGYPGLAKALRSAGMLDNGSRNGLLLAANEE